jgi:flagellar basal-body rod protein FlgC
VSLFHALNISSSGLSAQSLRAQVLAENLANAETTRTPEGGPYRRKDVIFQPAATEQSFSSVFNEVLEPQGVEVTEILVDDREPQLVYKPGHPDADANGYVAMPRVNPVEDMVDLMNASGSYQANLSAITAVKDMLQRSIDLFR